MCQFTTSTDKKSNFFARNCSTVCGGNWILFSRPPSLFLDCLFRSGLPLLVMMQKTSSTIKMQFAILKGRFALGYTLNEILPKLGRFVQNVFQILFVNPLLLLIKLTDDIWTINYNAFNKKRGCKYNH